MPSRSNYKKFFFLLYQNGEARRLFTPAPFVFLRIARDLRTHVVRAKVYPVEERLAGSRKCLRNRYQICKNVVETNTFTDLHVVSTKCLVYLLTCKVCGRQYTGQTVHEFRYRWNNYKDNNRESLRGDEHKKAGYFAHF